MGAILGGAMRAPFTAIFFALELTHDVNALLPLLVAAMLAHGTTVLLLKRSILTEKVARRGFHLTREYATDPLEALLVREAMRTQVAALPAEATIEDLRRILKHAASQRGQHLYPVVDREKRVRGVVTRKRLRELAEWPAADASLAGVLQEPVVAHPDEPLRAAMVRMADTGLTRFPVVDRDNRRLAGMISLDDLLLARVRNLHEERRRERVLRLRLPFGNRTGTAPD